ncbi:MAG: M20 family metallopeptidase [Halodesulfurarchaeum sp.]
MPDPELLELASDLVSIPSHEDATAAGDAIQTWLEAETDARMSRDDSGNVIARKGTGAPSLALVGHHDVVEPAADQVVGDEYRVERRDGRLHGRGTADMKGAVAAMLCAFRDATPAGELVFASFVGEEEGGVGARAAIERGFAPDFAVVGEGSAGYSAPGVLDVAVAHKGRRGSTIVIEGDAAHASEPEAGVNAVYRACSVIGQLRELAVPGIEVAGTTATGSLAVTGIEGGTAWNVIPAECTVTVDERTVPGERAAIESVAEPEWVDWTVEQDLPPMQCDDPAFEEVVLEAARTAQDAEKGEENVPQPVLKPHATDAGWLAEAGTTCVVCGPAEPGEAHTADESVSIELLEAARRCYERVGTAWPGTKR